MPQNLPNLNMYDCYEFNELGQGVFYTDPIQLQNCYWLAISIEDTSDDGPLDSHHHCNDFQIYGTITNNINNFDAYTHLTKVLFQEIYLSSYALYTTDSRPIVAALTAVRIKITRTGYYRTDEGERVLVAPKEKGSRIKIHVRRLGYDSF